MSKAITRLRRRRRKRIVYLILMLITITNSYLLAKYTSNISSSHNTNIAKWEVSYDTSDNSSDTLELVSGNNTQNYILKVTSTSEVSASYSIRLSSVPSEMRVKIDNGEYKVPTNNTIEFNNVGSFTGSDLNATFTHTLTFEAPLEANISNTNDININMTFTQIN